MKTTFKSGNRGFTLVELLIVTVIIGILAGLMMLTMGSATDSAEAAKLVADLRGLKASSAQYYLDYDTLPSEGLASGGGYSALAASLEKYLDRPFSMAYGVTVYFATSGDKFFYGLSPDSLSKGARFKLRHSGTIYTATGTQVAGGEPGPYFTIIK
jgi:general secretion pathway protein G